MTRRSTLLIGVVVALVAGLSLTLLHRSAPLVFPRRDAIRAALRDPTARNMLAHIRWSSAGVTPVDDRLERVSFYAGSQIVAEVAVAADGTVSHGADFSHRQVPYGDWIAYEPVVLLGLTVLFVLMTGVAPLGRLRNLDVAAIVSLVASMLLLQRRYVGASVLAAVPGLAYLALRGAWRGLGPPSTASPSTPLLARVTRTLGSSERVRLLRLGLGVLVLMYLMVGISSTDAVDVTYAVMEGATKVIGGVLPYGHLPGDVVHGDTYPLLSYLFYAPLAWIAPVRSTWDSVDGALAAAVATALVVAGSLFRSAVGSRRAPRPPHAEEAGLRLAVAWLAFPGVLIAVSTGTTDVVLAAIVIVAVLLWRRPAMCTGLLAVGGWFKLAPFALLPVAIGALRGRRLAVSLAIAGGVSALVIAVVVILGGPAGVAAMAHALSYQLSRGSPQSAWAALGLPALQPFVEGAVVGLVAAAAVRFRRDPQLAHDRIRVAALAAAILLGLQLAADYWAFLYVAWVAPLLCLSLLSDPVPAESEQAASAQPAVVPNFAALPTR